MLTVLACGRNGGGSRQDSSEAASSGIQEKTAHSGKHQKAVSQNLREFPRLSVPGIYTSPDDIFDYSGEHFWDGFFSGTGPTDTLSILGVKRGEVEQAVSDYIAILSYGVASSTPEDREPLHKSQKMIGSFFKNIEATGDTLVYLGLTEMVQRYLYDPNSPLRDEDLYLPFARLMASSPMTADDMKKACSHEAKKCAINQFGEKAPDFQYRSLSSGIHNLYGINADWTVLFFSNPGCTACKTIIDGIVAIPGINEALTSRKVAVLSMYVDEEVDKWRGYVHNYPRDWICGYDFTFSLRDGSDYDIRAIPSVYLLDAGKRVILKDAPIEKLAAYLSKVL